MKQVSILSLLASLSTAAFILATPAYADDFDSWNSKHQELKETAILEIGDIEKIQPPLGSQWKYDVLKISDKCVQLTSSYSEYWGYGKKAGLLVVDKYLYYKIAFIESMIGQSIKVTTVPVEMVDCQSTLNNQSPSLEKMLDEIKMKQEMFRRRQEALQKESNRLKLEQQKLNQ